MVRLSGGQALVESLKREGIDTIFGLPGVQLDWAFAALYDAKESIKVYHTRHEQATSYMADGYARATGKVGTCLVVPGPGLLNAMAGLSTAYACSSPVLCISGQINSEMIGKGWGMLHEIPQQEALWGSVAKWSARAMAPAEVPGLVRDAFTQLRSGRPRPVGLEIPPDVLANRAEMELPAPTRAGRVAGDPDLLRQAAELLQGAARPVIFASSGVIQAGASDELRQLAETLEAPVVLSANGRGALSDRHHLAHSMMSVSHLLQDADVILAVGTRFSDMAHGVKPGVRTIRLDIDPEEIGRFGQPTLAIVGDAKLGLEALLAGVDGTPKRASRADELNALKAKHDDFLFEHAQPQHAFTKVMREALPDDGIVVTEMTQLGYYAYVGFPIYEPRTFVTPSYQGTLGYGYTTALGAQVGRPDRKTIAICGDGGFMYTVQELATAKLHNIPVVAIVFSDNAFGNVKRIQKNVLGGKVIGSELLNPDFVALAASFGVAGTRARTPDELGGALREALATDGPSLIEVPVGELPDFWKVLYPESSETTMPKED
jgi:acetolactate synthase I/II/III large subunit